MRKGNGSCDSKVDAEAICEAVMRANMWFVPTKMPEQQSGLAPT